MGDFDGFTFTPADLCGVSMAALELIVAEEDSDKAYYQRHYQNFDWPEGASGPTIGIGVDCGYMTPAEVRANFAGIVDDATIAAIIPACGIRGEAAGHWVAAHRNSVTITWDQAIREFVKRELPQWVKHVTDDIPGAAQLPPDCLGALTSLAYNRGDGGFRSPGARFAEMRAIHDDVVHGNLADVPNRFLEMRRLWPAGGDLWRRRGHEAALFTHGLANAPAVPLPAVAAPPASTDPHDALWLQKALNAHGQSPPLFLDGVAGPMTQSAVKSFQARNRLVVDGVAGPATIAKLGAAP